MKMLCEYLGYSQIWRGTLRTASL